MYKAIATLPVISYSLFLLVTGAHIAPVIAINIALSYLIGFLISNILIYKNNRYNITKDIITSLTLSMIIISPIFFPNTVFLSLSFLAAKLNVSSDIVFYSIVLTLCLFDVIIKSIKLGQSKHEQKFIPLKSHEENKQILNDHNTTPLPPIPGNKTPSSPIPGNKTNVNSALTAIALSQISGQKDNYFIGRYVGSNPNDTMSSLSNSEDSRNASDTEEHLVYNTAQNDPSSNKIIDESVNSNVFEIESTDKTIDESVNSFEIESTDKTIDESVNSNVFEIENPKQQYKKYKDENKDPNGELSRSVSSSILGL